MYSPIDTPPPVEKIHKAQWTVENTRTTQAIVDRLALQIRSLDVLFAAKHSPGRFGGTREALRDAMHRFQQLDPKIEIPEDVR